MKRNSGSQDALEVSDGTVQSALHAHLAELSTGHRQILDGLKWHRQLPILCLGMSGALLSFALSGAAGAPLSASRTLALYLVPPLATAMGAAWLDNIWKIGQIGIYNRDELSPKVNQLLHLFSESLAPCFDVLGWESSDERLTRPWMMRLCEWMLVLSAFVGCSVIGQVLILLQEMGASQRFQQLATRAMFCFNSLLIVFSLLLFVVHLAIGRCAKSKSNLDRS